MKAYLSAILQANNLIYLTFDILNHNKVETKIIKKNTLTIYLYLLEVWTFCLVVLARLEPAATAAAVSVPRATMWRTIGTDFEWDFRRPAPLGSDGELSDGLVIQEHGYQIVSYISR